MKLWRPSYCACVIEELYDGHTITGPGAVVRRCPDHAHLPDAPGLYAALNTESRAAMNVYRHLLATMGETRSINGEPTRLLREGLAVRFTYTGQQDTRTLQVEPIGASGAERSTITREVARVDLAGVPVVVR